MKNIKVPLLKQGKMECGPTSLRMVLKYFNRTVSQKNIINKIGGLRKFGVRTIDLADFAKNIGFDVYCYSNNKKFSHGKADIKKPNKLEILKFLKKGLPVIISIRSYILYNKEKSNRGHFIVIVGYEKGKFIYNDPFDGKQKNIDEDIFMKALKEHSLDSSAYLISIKPRHK